MNEVKVLMIVDDDKDDRFFFRDAVKEIGSGWECREASDGEDALKKLRAADTLPDFIFLDINMPGMNGMEFLKEAKQDEKLKHIPVIMYSTTTYTKDIATAKELGAAYFLTKPFDIFEIPAGITKAIEEVEKTLQHSR